MITLLVIITIILTLVSIVACRQCKSYEDPWWKITAFMLAALSVIVLLVVVLIATIERANFGPTMAKIEQLRSDVQKANPQSAEHIYGQAVEMNMKIVEYQTQNKLFWFDQIIPDGWDNVKVIDIPNQSKVAETSK